MVADSEGQVPMVHGVGVDILGFKRMKWLDGKWDDPFIRMVFTHREREQALSSDSPIVTFTMRFSAKEAVFKALRINSKEVRLDQIEILEDKLNRPYCNLSGTMDEKARSFGEPYAVHISLSFEQDNAVAFAVLEAG